MGTREQYLVVGAAATREGGGHGAGRVGRVAAGVQRENIVPAAGRPARLKGVGGGALPARGSLRAVRSVGH